MRSIRRGLRTTRSPRPAPSSMRSARASRSAKAASGTCAPRADESREALTQHEMALRERQLSMQHLLTGVREKFRGLHLPRVVGDYHLRPPPDGELRDRITELTGLLDRMGSVNLDAMREHEEAEKRFTFYTTQKADLDKALSDLERAIQQMNRESKKLFEETFAAVNERFQTIFPKMFRGRSRRAPAHEPRRHARDRYRHHRAAARQEALEHRADERRREGPHGRLAHLRHLPDQAVAVLHPRRGRRPARRGERRSLLRHRSAR